MRGALEERARGGEGALEAEDQALLARYVDATEVPAERYGELARQRAEAIRELLASAHGIPPARLVVETAPEAGRPEVAVALRVGAASEPAVRAP